MPQNKKHFELLFMRLQNHFEQYSFLERNNAVMDLKNYLLMVCNDDLYKKDLNLISVLNFKNQIPLIETVFKSIKS